MNITIIGNGGWGTALSILLNRNNHNITVWGALEKEINQIKKDSINTLYLPGINIPNSINWTSDITCTKNADIVIFVVPSRYYENTLNLFKNNISENTYLLSATKGFHEKTYETMSMITKRILNITPAVLSGPSHAEEVSRGIPCAVSIASKNNDIANFLQSIFINDSFKVYTSDDVKGVELGGALKNIIAIAAGISDGLGYGDNTKAALMTRGLSEMKRLGVLLDARPETFSGLSGIGDLMVTCMSLHSRNRKVGERLGCGESLRNIFSGMKMVVEGVDNCQAAVKLSQSFNISLPIIEEVNNIVHYNKDPKQAMLDLMRRSPKTEF